MGPDDHIEVRLELDRASDPIRGRLFGPDGEGSEFYGWLQFMAAVDAARASATEGSS
jgi:hypothetical protein